MERNEVDDEIKEIISACISGFKYGIKIRFPHALVMTFLFPPKKLSSSSSSSAKDITIQQKLKIIGKLSYAHAVNLAKFATLYKTVLFLLKIHSRRRRRFRSLRSVREYSSSTTKEQSQQQQQQHHHQKEKNNFGYPDKPIHSLIAGFLGGYFVWGSNYESGVNYQILLYLTSRVIVGCFKLIFLQHAQVIKQKKENGNKENNFIGQRILYRLVQASVWGSVMILFEKYPHVLQKSLKKSMDEIYRR